MYRALGAAEPVFAHLPLILGPDKQRLSKRHGATAVGSYREQGVLPEALVNFLALLGWAPPEQKEILPLEEMIRSFELKDVSKSNAVFDLEKLAWMNSEYLRHLPAARLLSLVEGELQKAGVLQLAEGSGSLEEEDRFKRTVLLLQSRARTLKDFPGPFRAFFADDFEYDPEAQKKFWKDASLTELLEAIGERLGALDPFDAAAAEKCLRGLAEEKSVKAGLLINATRVALTGQAVAPPLFDVMVALGRERVAARLHRAANFLGAGRG
jgi:glutamyl-tRNA synthetase